MATLEQEKKTGAEGRGISTQKKKRVIDVSGKWFEVHQIPSLSEKTSFASLGQLVDSA